jgi:hypothetical protein
VSDRLDRFSGDSWQEIEALPESVRWTVRRVMFHLLEEPVPTPMRVGNGSAWPARCGSGWTWAKPRFTSTFYRSCRRLSTAPC